MRYPSIDEWIAALRSGEFKQGRNGLANVKDGEERNCCLGVLYRKAEVPETTERTAGDNFVIFDDGTGDGWAYPSDEFMAKYGMTCHGEPIARRFLSVSVMNDRYSSFEEIADQLEKWKEEGIIHDAS